MQFNGNSPDEDTTITATVAGTECSIITNGGHTYILLENKWELWNRKKGTFRHDYLFSDRISAHKIQVRDGNPSSFGTSYTKKYIGKSMASAYNLVDFLNKEIPKTFSTAPGDLQTLRFTCCMVHALTLLKHLGLLDKVTPFASAVCTEDQMKQMKRLVQASDI